MNYFGSKHFYNYIKNKKSIRFINQNKINKVKAFCLNKLETRALVCLKNSSSSIVLSSLFSNPLGISLVLLSKLSKLKSMDIEGKIIYKPDLEFIMNTDLINKSE